MNKISFGKYIPTNSFIHKMDPRFKLVLLIALIVSIFISQNYFSFLLVLAAAVFCMLVSKVRIKLYLSNLKPILPIVILTSLLSAIYIKTGDVITIWKINIYSDAIEQIVFIMARILLLVIFSALLSYSTSPTMLTGALESLLSPLRFIGLKNAVHTLAMTMTIALRFIPTLIDETEKIMNAQKARGADFENGSLLKRVKALIPILVPLLISSVRRAEELSNAMECRCYNGADGRTRYKVLKCSYRDLIATFIVAIIIAAIFLLNFYF